MWVPREPPGRFFADRVVAPMSIGRSVARMVIEYCMNYFCAGQNDIVTILPAAMDIIVA